MIEKAIKNWKIGVSAFFILVVVVAFMAGLALGGWLKVVQFREHLEKIPDINQCYGEERRGGDVKVLHLNT